jgi:hypothetical protein
MEVMGDPMNISQYETVHLTIPDTNTLSYRRSCELGNMKWRDKLGDLGVEGGITIKLILQTRD